MASTSSNSLVQVLRKIPLFTGLSPSQLQKILTFCTPRSYSPEEVLCEVGSHSEEMFVLLSGQLAIITREGLQVANLKPVTTVGEVGVVTRQPRSATVGVIEKCNTLILKRGQFEHLLRDNQDIQVVVYRNIIDILGQRLTNDNIRVRDYVLEKTRFESQLREERRRTSAAMRLLMEQSGMEKDQVEAQITSVAANEVPTILVVDDEAGVHKVTKRILAEFFSVLEAENGEEALTVIAEQQPDLVITDIKMPEMDGFTLLDNIRERFPDIPVLAISGYIDAEDIEGKGFNGFLHKPLQMDELRGLVDANLN
jgi:CheY-like chemotaxis protein